MKKKDEIEKVPKCRICAHPDREGIEMLGMLSAASWNVCRERINNTFGTNFSVKTVKTHMLEHELHTAAAENGIIIDSIRNKNGAPAVISVENMMQTLLVQGMLDLAKGKIRCKTPQELISVANMLQNIQLRKEQKMAFENGDLQGFYTAMAAYGEAMKDTLSPGQMVEVVAKANALGAVLDIGHIPMEKPIDIDPGDVMHQAVADYKMLGRSRTRDELVSAGVIDEIENELDLPESEWVTGE